MTIAQPSITQAGVVNECEGSSPACGLLRLVAAVKALSHARSVEEIASVVRRAARELGGADGATFVLRDGSHCYYYDEDAVAPLWKGHRFPMEICISGWVMMHKTAVAIADIYQDSRVPHEAYRPTFVKSLVMVPVRREAPVAAIGSYWARDHVATREEIELFQVLADSTSVAMENVRVSSELEQRVRERTVELEAANRDLDAFSYSIAHDLRDPVGVINGFATLLRRELGDTSHKALRYVDRIESAAARMGELIDDLLGLARASRAEPVRVPVDVSALAREVQLGLVESGPERHVDFEVQRDLIASADPALLRVLLQNIMSNAYKYSSKAPRAVVEVGRVDNHVEHPFYVRDNGVGFDPALAERLFKPLQRLHSADEFPGTGIGLATCEKIVRQHGGRIWAESEPGRGATFYFTLAGPAADPGAMT